MLPRSHKVIIFSALTCCKTKKTFFAVKICHKLRDADSQEYLHGFASRKSAKDYYTMLGRSHKVIIFSALTCCKTKKTFFAVKICRKLRDADSQEYLHGFAIRQHTKTINIV